jgi:hypothetical protein
MVFLCNTMPPFLSIAEDPACDRKTQPLPWESFASKDATNHKQKAKENQWDANHSADYRETYGKAENHQNQAK